MDTLINKHCLYSCKTPSCEVVLSVLIGDSLRIAGYQVDFTQTNGSYHKKRSFGPDERAQANLYFLCSVNNVLSSID